MTLRIRTLRSVLSPEQVLGNKPNIGRTLGKPPHEVRIPLGSEWNIDSNSPSLSCQLLLQVAPDPVQHLELKRVRRNALDFRPALDFRDNRFIVSRQAMKNTAFQQVLGHP